MRSVIFLSLLFPVTVSNASEASGYIYDELTQMAISAAASTTGTACIDSEISVDALGWGLTCSGSDASAVARANARLAEAKANCTNNGGTVVDVRGIFCGNCAFSLAGFWTACGYNFKCRRCQSVPNTGGYFPQNTR